MVRLKQGDIIKISFDPAKGNEEAKYRPALVVSNDDYNNYCGGIILLCPISHSKDFPLHIDLPKGIQTDGKVLCEHIKALDVKARPYKYVEHLSDDYMSYISEILKACFKMNKNNDTSSIDETLKKFIQNGYNIIGCGSDIYGNTYYAAEMCNSIYLVNQVYSPFNTVACLHFDFQIENKYEKKIYLEDIQMGLNDANKGYGSILLSSLINLAKRLDVEYIYGEFSRVDEDTDEHIKRRKYFYEKFGFEINGNCIKLQKKDF